MCLKRNNAAGPVQVLGGMMPTASIKTGGLSPVIALWMNFVASAKFRKLSLIR
jgi:hypothetical protein